MIDQILPKLETGLADMKAHFVVIRLVMVTHFALSELKKIADTIKRWHEDNRRCLAVE